VYKWTYVHSYTALPGAQLPWVDNTYTGCVPCHNKSVKALSTCVDECVRPGLQKSVCGHCVFGPDDERVDSAPLSIDECITCTKQAGRLWNKACR